MINLGLIALSLGFLGSFHCVGMCGPIALALPLNRSNRFTKLSGIVSYNLGRVITYSILGMLFGMLGYGLVISGLQQTLSILAGTLMIIIAVAPFFLGKIGGRFFPYAVFSKLKASLKYVIRKKGNIALFILGSLNGLLPCGLVYIGIASAITTGDWLNGGLFMALFGWGTLPAMIALSTLGNSISMSARKRITHIMPGIIVTMGLLLILRGMNLGIPYLSPELSASKPVCHKCCHK
jgi:sulfite exporter TauE/SafE